MIERVTGLSGTTDVIRHDADELLNPGLIHDNWMRLLNDAAAGLRELRDNNVVVLWRPMHGNNLAWWWSTLGHEGYRRVDTPRLACGEHRVSSLWHE